MSLLDQLRMQLQNKIFGSAPYISPLSDAQDAKLLSQNSQDNFDYYMKQKGFKLTANNQWSDVSPTPTPLPSSLAPSQQGSQYDPTILQSAKQTGVPAPLLKATLSHESMGFNPKYVTGYHTDGTGRGIGGIDKVWHPEVSDEDAFNPQKAIPWVANNLARLYKKNGNWQDALREYNGGGNYNASTLGFGGIPVAQRTIDYAKNVFNQMKAYASGNGNTSSTP